MLIRILDVMIPVIAVAGLGYLYSLRYRTDLAAINAISVNVFLPALVFTVMSSQDFDLGSYPGLAIAATAVFFGSAHRLAGRRPAQIQPPDICAADDVQ